MRTLTALATTAALLFSFPATASAVWVSVNDDSFQIQHVCRDGVVFDMASRSDKLSTKQIWVADATAQEPWYQYFFTGSVQVPPFTIDVPAMREPGDQFRSMGRNYRLPWNTSRTPGSEVQVTGGNTSSFMPYRVEDCLVHDRFDPFTVGYVLADKPVTPSYRPAPHWSYNSKMLVNSVNSVIRTGVGAYTVEFPGLAGFGGNAHVTALADVLATCKIGPSRWYQYGAAIRLDVRCFNAAGTAADSRFTASYTAGGGAANTIAFALAHQPTTDSYLAHSVYQYNNAGGAITVSRENPGNYLVHMPNDDGPRQAGSVQVTAVGATAVACKADKWAPTSSAQVVRVRCFTPSGTAADQQFTIAYVDRMNVLGSNVMATGYVRADEPLTQSYPPPAAYQDNRTVDQSATVTVSRFATGKYDVMLPLQHTSGAGWDGGTVLVTAYGPGSARCQIGYWKDAYVAPVSGRVVRVHCFTAAGAPTDTMFTLQYTAQIQ